jgi:hypothetical protein
MGWQDPHVLSGVGFAQLSGRIFFLTLFLFALTNGNIWTIFPNDLLSLG